jgi:hypothetical protein
VTVFFCTTGGLVCTASPSNTTDGVIVTAPQSGSPYATVQAQSPPVGPGGVGSYYVQVQSNNQSSAFSNVATGAGLSPPVFTYSVLVPLVTGVSPQTPVAPHSPITITGFNFVNGVTVGFCPQTNAAPYYAAACVAAGGNAGGAPVTVTPTSTTQIVVNVPTLPGPAGTVYYPIVGVSPYTGANQPGNPYVSAADQFTYS